MNKELEEQANNYKCMEKATNNYKDETISNLMDFRNKLIGEIAQYNKKINDKQVILKECNEFICSFAGHKFSDWEEKEDMCLDRSWYYVRKCNVCGKTERQEYEPKEYQDQLKKIKTR